MHSPDPSTAFGRHVAAPHLMSPRNALVVEGGAMRGIFACGVLEVFQEQRFQPFGVAIGTSAGSCILASHLSELRGRSHAVYTKYMTRPEFISAKRFFRGGHWVDFDWLWHATERDIPLNRTKLFGNTAKFVVSATSFATGEAVFLEPNDADLMQVLKGSCAIPILCRGSVNVGDQRLLDGGIAAPIPVDEAYRRGARRILVIRSRPPRFVKKKSSFGWLTTQAFRSSPPFARALRSASDRYRAAVDFIHAPPPDCKIVHVAPDAPLATGRTTQDLRALEHDFALGREAGMRAIEAWREQDLREAERATAAP